MLRSRSVQVKYKIHVYICSYFESKPLIMMLISFELVINNKSQLMIVVIPVIIVRTATDYYKVLHVDV